ncbi:MAG TPA: O-antigen ligase domain-containing protein [Roseiflexaceae bacterium]|nr:O-antigen ligase domain-containing protein [Roseiflexaceae bacterium]HMP39241.1 O-antigen ligase domain-containing protein [Roseiflexaceae bacterium]
MFANRFSRQFDFFAQRPQIRSALLMTLILIATLAASIVIGYFASRGSTRVPLAAIALPGAVFGFYMLTRKFELLVLLLPITALAIPIDVPTGTFTQLPISLLLTIALLGVWGATSLIRNQWHLVPSPINRPLIIFGVLMCVSTVWGTIWRDPVLNMALFKNFEIVQIASLITYLASIGVTLLIGNFITTPGRLKIVLGSFIFFGALMTITQLFRIPQSFLADRGLWGLWTVIPALALVIIQPRLHWSLRLLLLVIIAANLYQTVYNNLLWKSGWIPTVCAIFVAVFLRSRRWFAVVMLALILLVVIQQDFFMRMIEDEINEGADGRIGMWEINLRVVGEHWLFGTGPAGYAPYYMNYYPYDARSTHNNYLDIIAQFGVIGTIGWFALALTASWEGLRLYRKAPRGILKTAALVTLSGWIGAQVSMFFGDWLLPFAYNQTITGYKYTVYSWIFLGLIIALRHMIDTDTSIPHDASFEVANAGSH